MTIQLHMDSHEGTYTKKFTAKVEASFPGIVELDKTAFYHLGGGQPADNGKIVWDGGEATVKDVRKKNRIRHFIDGDSPEIGTLIEGEIDWERINLTKKWYAQIKSRHTFRGILEEKLFTIPASKYNKNLDFK